MPTLVIVGGGHAAAQLCGALAEARKQGQFNDRIVLVSEEAHLPYHRPPLSKQLIKSPQAALPELKPLSFYQDAQIELRLQTRALAIDPAARTLTLRDAEGQESALAWDRLVLATGARARHLPGMADNPPGVHVLRTFDDATRVRDAITAAGHLMVLGGGFIGLEVAATARALGKQVTVIEAAPRLLGRAVSPALSEHVLAVHRQSGMTVHLGQAPQGLVLDASGRFAGVNLAGEVLGADLLLLGIGATPDTTLARSADLALDTTVGGIRVDGQLRTSHPDIHAIGDCCACPGPDGRPQRLESIQNANDQGKTLAAVLLGQDVSHAAVPSFWSDQGEVRLQMAGLWRADLQAVRRPGAKDGSFSWLHYDGDTLVAVESVNAPMDHLAAKKWLQAGHSPARAAAADPAVPLKDL